MLGQGHSGIPQAGIELVVFRFAAFMSMMRRAEYGVGILNDSLRDSAIKSKEASRAFQHLEATQQEEILASIEQTFAAKKETVALGILGNVILVVGNRMSAATVQIRTYRQESQRTEAVLQRVAKVHDITAASLKAYTKTVEDNAQSMSKARGYITQFENAQLDANDAVRLAAVANDVAAGTTGDTAKAYDLLTHAAVNASVSMLNSLRVGNSADRVFAAYAATIGTTAEKLTDTERRLATLDYEFRIGAQYAGAYDATLGTLWHAQNELNGAWSEAKDSLGRGITPALMALMYAATLTLKAFNALPKGIKALIGGTFATTGALLALIGTINTTKISVQLLTEALNAKGIKTFSDVTAALTKRMKKYLQLDTAKKITANAAATAKDTSAKAANTVAVNVNTTAVAANNAVRAKQLTLDAQLAIGNAMTWERAKALEKVYAISKKQHSISWLLDKDRFIRGTQPHLPGIVPTSVFDIARDAEAGPIGQVVDMAATKRMAKQLDMFAQLQTKATQLKLEDAPRWFPRPEHADAFDAYIADVLAGTKANRGFMASMAASNAPIAKFITLMGKAITVQTGFNAVAISTITLPLIAWLGLVAVGVGGVAYAFSQLDKNIDKHEDALHDLDMAYRDFITLKKANIVLGSDITDDLKRFNFNLEEAVYQYRLLYTAQDDFAKGAQIAREQINLLVEQELKRVREEIDKIEDSLDDLGTEKFELRVEIHDIDEEIAAIEKQMAALDLQVRPQQKWYEQVQREVTLIKIPLQLDKLMLEKILREVEDAADEVRKRFDESAEYLYAKEQLEAAQQAAEGYERQLSKVAREIAAIEEQSAALDRLLQPLREAIALEEARATIAVAPLIEEKIAIEETIVAYERQMEAIRKSILEGQEYTSITKELERQEDILEDIAEKIAAVDDAMSAVREQEYELDKALWPFEDALARAEAAATLIIIPLERQKKVIQAEIAAMEEAAAVEQKRYDVIISALEERIRLQEEVYEQASEYAAVLDHELFMERLRNTILRKAGSARQLELESERRVQDVVIAKEQERLQKMKDELDDQKELAEIQKEAADKQIEAANKQIEAIDAMIDAEKERITFLEEELAIAKALQFEERQILIEKMRRLEEERKALIKQQDVVKETIKNLEDRLAAIEKAMNEQLDIIGGKKSAAEARLQAIEDAINSEFKYSEELKRQLAIEEAKQVAQQINFARRIAAQEEIKRQIEKELGLVDDEITKYEDIIKKIEEARDAELALIEARKKAIEEQIAIVDRKITEQNARIEQQKLLVEHVATTIAQQKKDMQDQVDELNAQKDVLDDIVSGVDWEIVLLERKLKIQQDITDELELQRTIALNTIDDIQNKLQEEADKTSWIDEFWEAIQQAVIRSGIFKGILWNSSDSASLQGAFGQGAVSGGLPQQTQGPTTVTNNYSIQGHTVQVDAAYANSQSPASVREDVELALQIAR